MRRPRPTMPAAPPGSLAEARSPVADPRRAFGWRGEEPAHHLVALWQGAVAAKLCGSGRLNAIAPWVRERVADDPALRTARGRLPGRMPGVAPVERIVKALDVAACERGVGQWRAGPGVTPTDAVAVDGTTLRGVARPGVPGVHLVRVDAQAAQTGSGQVRPSGTGHELAATPLAGRVVSGDAMLTQHALCTRIVQQGGARWADARTHHARTDGAAWPLGDTEGVGGGGWALAAPDRTAAAGSRCREYGRGRGGVAAAGPGRSGRPAAHRAGRGRGGRRRLPRGEPRRHPPRAGVRRRARTGASSTSRSGCGMRRPARLPARVAQAPQRTSLPPAATARLRCVVARPSPPVPPARAPAPVAPCSPVTSSARRG